MRAQIQGRFVCTAVAVAAAMTAEARTPDKVCLLLLQDKKASALLQQPGFHDGEGVKEAALTLLRHATPAEEVVITGKQLLGLVGLSMSKFLISTTTLGELSWQDQP